MTHSLSVLYHLSFKCIKIIEDFLPLSGAGLLEQFRAALQGTAHIFKRLMMGVLYKERQSFYNCLDPEPDKKNKGNKKVIVL